jgi:hypothetical protein
MEMTVSPWKDPIPTFAIILGQATKHEENIFSYALQVNKMI